MGHILFWGKLYEKSYEAGSPLLQRETHAFSTLKKILGGLAAILWTVTIALVVADIVVSKMSCFKGYLSIPEICSNIFTSICFSLSFPGTLAFVWFNYRNVFQNQLEVIGNYKKNPSLSRVAALAIACVICFLCRGIVVCLEAFDPPDIAWLSDKIYYWIPFELLPLAFMLMTFLTVSTTTENSLEN